MTQPAGRDDDDLDLPPSDGAKEEDDALAADTQDELPLAPDTDPDALDDTVAGEAVPGDDDMVAAEDGSLLDGTDEAADGAFGDGVEGFAEGGLDDEPSKLEVDDDAFTDPDSLPAMDGGEEGFEGDDEGGLDALPDLDADEEGAGDELHVGEIDQEPDLTLPWDDRAFERACGPIGVGTVRAIWLEGDVVVARTDDSVVEVSAQGAVLARRSAVGPPQTPSRRPTRAGATAEVTWAGGLLSAVWSEQQSRAWLVRSAGEPEEARIVADVSDDVGDADPAPVLALAVEPSRGWVWAGGAFGLLAYRRR